MLNHSQQSRPNVKAINHLYMKGYHNTYTNDAYMWQIVPFFYKNHEVETNDATTLIRPHLPFSSKNHFAVDTISIIFTMVPMF